MSKLNPLITAIQELIAEEEPCEYICIAAERDESSCSECGTVYWRD